MNRTLTNDTTGFTFTYPSDLYTTRYHTCTVEAKKSDSTKTSSNKTSRDITLAPSVLSTTDDTQYDSDGDVIMQDV